MFISPKFKNCPFLRSLGLSEMVDTDDYSTRNHAKQIETYDPSTGYLIALVDKHDLDVREKMMNAASIAFIFWKNFPAPKRGEVVRQIGNKFREHKRELAELISLEMGKIISEAEGEVQEAIDICDYAVGLSRNFGGITVSSEREKHRLYEQWYPLGIVGVITAFNFPVAVLAWNAAIALVCGNTIVWKPSEKTPLISLAIDKIIKDVLKENKIDEYVFSTIIGGRDAGERLAVSGNVPLVSATGSCAMGKAVSALVGNRMGRTILELSGNNAMIITPNANSDLAIRAAVFAAVGTSGQRCTTLRRLIVHEDIKKDVINRLIKAYSSITVGDPLLEDDEVPGEKKSLMGPLIDQRAVSLMERTIEDIKRLPNEEGCVLYGGKAYDTPGYFVEPTIVEMADPLNEHVQEETFAPILYVLSYKDIDEAIAIQNNVKQGLSSCIFTDNLQEAEEFLSVNGSDCGIANVNIGTSGAEIGSAFGGEKDTGGGRESGSDAWKQYMRRQTCTINYGKDLPLAQGVEFDIEGE